MEVDAFSSVHDMIHAAIDSYGVQATLRQVSGFCPEFLPCRQLIIESHQGKRADFSKPSLYECTGISEKTQFPDKKLPCIDISWLL